VTRVDCLRPILEELDSTQTSFQSDSGFGSECDVARKFILGEIEGKSISSVPELCELILPMKRAFPSVYKLHAGALTFGASTAVCEASFSVLTKLLRKKLPIDES